MGWGRSQVQTFNPAIFKHLECHCLYDSSVRFLSSYSTVRHKEREMLATLEENNDHGFSHNIAQLQIIRWKFMTLQKVKVDVTKRLSQPLE